MGKELYLNTAEFVGSHTGYVSISLDKNCPKFLFKWVKNKLAAPESFRDWESF